MVCLLVFAGQVELKGTKISISPELGQCRSDLIGTYQSGNGTQVDRKSGLLAKRWVDSAIGALLTLMGKDVVDRPEGEHDESECRVS